MCLEKSISNPFEYQYMYSFCILNLSKDSAHFANLIDWKLREKYPYEDRKWPSGIS